MWGALERRPRGVRAGSYTGELVWTSATTYTTSATQPKQDGDGRAGAEDAATGAIADAPIDEEELQLLLDDVKGWDVRWGSEASDRPDVRVALPRIKVRRFFQSVSLLADPDRPEDGYLFYNVGDPALDEHGVACFVPKWCYFWEDIVSRAADPRSQGDGGMRGRREVFVGAETSTTGAHLVLDDQLEGNLNYVHNLLRPCTLTHLDEIDNIEAFEAGQDCYWYRYAFDSSLLRWEFVPPPSAVAAGWSPATLPADQPLRMVDLCAGLGTVSHAASCSGFQPVCGVEVDAAASSSLCANTPSAGGEQMSLEQFNQALARGEEGVPAPKSVAYLHASPPCQALSSRNLYRSLGRYSAELVPLLDQVSEAVERLQPAYFTLEELVQLLLTRLPLKEPPRKGRQPGKRQRMAAAADEGCDGAEGDANEEEEEAEVMAGSSSEGEEEEAGGSDGTGSIEVRPVLPLLGRLLLAGYQVDVRVLNSAHYGVPQCRQRAYLLAAHCGFQLPLPPPPQYSAVHTPSGVFQFKLRDPLLLTLGNWEALWVQSEPGLPPAVTVEEAIHDLPLLLGGKGGRTMPAGRACLPYRPRIAAAAAEQADAGGTAAAPGGTDAGAGISRYVQYMREGAVPGLLLHHQRRPGEKGSSPIDRHGPFTTVCGFYHSGVKSGRAGKAQANQHPDEARWWTIAERKRAQSLPDRLQLFGTLGQQAEQVGNAVPWLQAKAVSDAVYRAATGRPALHPGPLLKGFLPAVAAGAEGSQPEA